MNDITIGKRIRSLRENLDMTQEELAHKIGSTKQAVFKYEAGIVTNIPMSKIELIAKALGCSPAYLLGWSNDTDAFQYRGIKPVSSQRIPLLGKIACGKPIFADETHESYIIAGSEIRADFCLIAQGDSMIGARINDGDIVFCTSQPVVKNGDIAVVLISDEATLKRFYYYPEKQKLVLQSENPQYEPFVYVGAELEDIKVLGKAIAFQSNIK